MDELVKAALLGTGKHPFVLPPDADPATLRIASQTRNKPEKVLLLIAGSRSIYESAGAVTQQVPTLDPSPNDTGTPPSPRLTTLLSAVLSAQSINLLPEFLLVLRDQNIFFPASLVPQALNMQDERRRDQLRQVLGSRARWLARFNPAWGWILQDPLAPIDIPKQLQLLEEGNLNERLLAFREVRKADPALARSTLQSFILDEKGDLRRKFLEELRVRLSLDDAELLESFLQDRSKRVKEIAEELLLLIPGSALSRRLCDAAQQILRPTQSAAGEFRLTCDIPAAEMLDEIPQINLTEPPSGIGPRLWSIREVISRCPPSCWTELFQLPPQELTSGILNDDSAAAVVSGWVGAVISFPEDPNAAAWRRPLFHAGVEICAKQMVWREVLIPQLTMLASQLPASELDEIVADLLQGMPLNRYLPFEQWLGLLPAPWSADLSQRYLTITRKMFQISVSSDAVHWTQTLLPAALGLAPECFSSALEPWSVNVDRQGNWSSRQLEPILQRFGEVIRSRHEFRQEALRCAEQAQG